MKHTLHTARIVIVELEFETPENAQEWEVHKIAAQLDQKMSLPEINKDNILFTSLWPNKRPDILRVAVVDDDSIWEIDSPDAPSVFM